VASRPAAGRNPVVRGISETIASILSKVARAAGIDADISLNHGKSDEIERFGEISEDFSSISVVLPAFTEIEGKSWSICACRLPHGPPPSSKILHDSSVTRMGCLPPLVCRFFGLIPIDIPHCRMFPNEVPHRRATLVTVPA
jgi:uncharacterized protein Veg